MNSVEFDRKVEELIRDGYRAQAPKNNGWVEDDKKAAKTWQCFRCAEIGAIYRPFWLEKDDDYIAFMVCKKCGWVSEV